MDDFVIVISLIFLIATVLQVILFFKIWEMTKDVKRIKNEFLPFVKWSKFNIRVNILSGNKEKAKKLIIEKFFCSIYYEPKNFYEHKRTFEKELGQIGESVPDKIKELKSYNHFEQIFK
ncbi:MAG: hypothetical protein LBK94_11010 [Prevotellaceae bacterium]|jgi:hypothetical protein|nr:hypothetical protein [Prevotellaceae bacterium]